MEDKYGLWIGCYVGLPMNFMPSHSEEVDTVDGPNGDRNGLLVGFEDLEIF